MNKVTTPSTPETISETPDENTSGTNPLKRKAGRPKGSKDTYRRKRTAQSIKYKVIDSRTGMEVKGVLRKPRPTSIDPAGMDMKEAIAAGHAPLSPSQIAHLRGRIGAIIRDNIHLAERVLNGEVKWSNQQVAVFRALMDKTVPNLSASMHHHEHTSSEMKRITKTELERIALGLDGEDDIIEATPVYSPEYATEPHPSEDRRERLEPPKGRGSVEPEPE